MSSASLVPCPACSQRRDLISIEQEAKGRGELRSFRCRECKEVISYLMQGRASAPIIIIRRLE